jgi:predicted DNA-binding mobile mystery protein A
MRRFFQKTTIDQIQRVQPQLLQQSPPKEGWIKIMRTALGMTTKQLAQRLDCSQSNVSALEDSEKNQTISLQSLEQTAQALNCRVVYFLVPKKPLDQLLEEQAHKVAQQRLQRIGHSMALEQQALTPEQNKEQEKALVDELLHGNLKHLWED